MEINIIYALLIFSTSVGFFLMIMSVVTIYIIYRTQIFHSNLRNIIYVNIVFFFMLGGVMNGRNILRIQQIYPFYESYLTQCFYMLLIPSFLLSSLVNLERVYAFINIKTYDEDESKFSFFNVITFIIVGLITIVVLYISRIHVLISSFDIIVSFFIIHLFLSIIYFYTVFKIEQMFRPKSKLQNIILPLSSKYSLKQIHKNMILLTIIICISIFFNLEMCIHLYIISGYKFTLNEEIIHYIVFHLSVYLGALIKMFAIILLQEKARKFVYEHFFRIKGVRVSPETQSRYNAKSEGAIYFSMYSNQWN